MSELERLELYKYYQEEDGQLVETDLSCLYEDQPFIYMGTTPTTPANFNFQIWQDPETLLFQDFTVDAISYMSHPEAALKKLQEFS